MGARSGMFLQYIVYLDVTLQKQGQNMGPLTPD